MKIVGLTGGIATGKSTVAKLIAARGVPEKIARALLIKGFVEELLDELDDEALTDALKEWRDAKSKGAMSETQAGFLIARIDRILDTLIARETTKVEEGLGSLAIVATASPFIGLFGTVWGIMHAFVGLANVQQATLASVAPGIAEALIATAIGLFAAIPAVVAYNRYANDIDRLSTQFESFVEEFLNILQRQH